MATLAFRIAEIERRLANLARMGVVEQVDAEAARVRVRVGTLLTAWIPWLTQRAGSSVRVWGAPTIGEQVLVLSPSGDMAQGVALPAIFRADFAPPSNLESVHRTEYADGTVIEYDQDAHKLTATVQGPAEVTATGDITATSSSKISLTAPEVEVTGLLKVSQDVQVGPTSISFLLHKHAGKPATTPSEFTGPPLPA